MPPRIALSLDSDATAPRALEQVLRDRHEHVFVLRSDDPIGDIDAAAPDVVVVTGQGGAELAQAIRARYGDEGPRIIAVFPECEGAPAGSFDEHIAGPLCARTVAGLLARRELKGP